MSIKNDNFISRIAKLADSPHLSAWEQGFMGSLKSTLDKWGSLTAKQHSVLQSIESKNDPVQIAARKSWAENFTDEMREKLVIAARYYIDNPPYFAEAADRVLADEEYVPSQKLYIKMVENKYVNRVIANIESEPTYPAGSMACVRATASGTLGRLRNKLVMVVEYPDKLPRAAKGAKPVVILPVGSTEMIETEERWLKRASV
jgi:hypothetical protein